jgi:hypothetical protein
MIAFYDSVPSLAPRDPTLFPLSERLRASPTKNNLPFPLGAYLTLEKVLEGHPHRE